MIKVTFEQGAAPGAGELPVRREQEEKPFFLPVIIKVQRQLGLQISRCTSQKLLGHSDFDPNFFTNSFFDRGHISDKDPCLTSS